MLSFALKQLKSSIQKALETTASDAHSSETLFRTVLLNGEVMQRAVGIMLKCFWHQSQIKHMFGFGFVCFLFFKSPLLLFIF